jgi:hypothetical protein
MLPPPQSSCAGWWLSRLWLKLLERRPERHAIWHIEYPAPGEILLRPFGGPHPLQEAVTGMLRDEDRRRMLLNWEWPGEDGMRHTFRGAWEIGDTVTRPLDWVRTRQPSASGSISNGNPGPWPLRVRLDIYGWHGQTLERAEILAADGQTRMPVLWDARQGEPRIPRTELPCAMTALSERDGERVPALSLAGLTLPWRIDVDRDAWPVWRRLSADTLLYELGGPSGQCPRHGSFCPWPTQG